MVVNKHVKLIVYVALVSMATLSLAGCSSQNQGTMMGNQGTANNSNMTQYMKSNPTEMMNVLSSPDTRQSMVKIMGSTQMMPVMVDVMKNSEAQNNMRQIMGSSQNHDNMVSIMADPSMVKPMVKIMSDPRMKTTFASMLKDPAMQPMVNEAMGKGAMSSK